MSGKKIFLITLAVAALILLASKWAQVQAALAKFGVPKLGGDAGSPDAAANGNTGFTGGGTSTGGGSASLNWNKILRKGSNGPEVQVLQTWLYSLNARMKRVVTRYGADGNFGTETETLLKAYAGGVTSTTLSAAQPMLNGSGSVATPAYTGGGAATSIGAAANSIFQQLGLSYTRPN
jgi:hypothetical protein